MEVVKEGRCLGLNFELTDGAAGPGYATLYSSGIIHFESDDGASVTTHAFRADIVWRIPEEPGAPQDEDRKVLSMGKKTRK